MSKLSVNPSILLSPVSEGYLVYNTTTNRLHELNPTAALLVELCNGERSFDDVLSLASPLLPPDSASSTRDWLQQALDEEVLVAGSNEDGPQQMSAEQLAELADKLRDEGKIQAAYLCQQRAIELQPDDNELLRDLGELAHILGYRSAARNAYEQYLALRPDDAEIQHLLTSLRGNATPDRVPDDCIQHLYQRFSEFYESNMCDELGYEGPLHLREVIDAALGDRRNLSILDLGCGTGLAGMAVAERARRLVGVDLSPEMIERAKRRERYDELHVAEVTAWLEGAEEKFDLILACDTLIYFGDLHQVLTPAATRLNEHGVFAFSVERAESSPFRLMDNGRYAHHPDHIETVAHDSGLRIVRQTEAFLRMEYGQEVTGVYTSLQ